jgi:hypothetical protein
LRLVRAQRRLLLFLAAVSVALALLQHVAGGVDLVLGVSPVLLVFGIALSGKLPGEKWLIARHVARPPRRRRARVHWTREREQQLISLIERSPRLLRGPPASAAAHC